MRRAATKVVQRCFSPEEKAKEPRINAGEIETDSVVGDKTYHYMIDVKTWPEGMPGDGWKVKLFPHEINPPRNPHYNVYEAGGETSGQRRKWGLAGEGVAGRQ